MGLHILKKRSDIEVEIAIPAAVLVSCYIEEPHQEGKLIQPLGNDLLLNALTAAGAAFAADRFYALEEYARAISLPWRQLAKVFDTAGKERVLRLGDRPTMSVRAAKPSYRHFVLPLLLLGDRYDSEGLYFEIQMPELLEETVRQAGFPEKFLEIYPAILHRSQVVPAAAMQQAAYTVLRFEKGQIDVDRPPPVEWIAALEWPQFLPLPPKNQEEEYDYLLPFPIPQHPKDQFRPLAGTKPEEYAFLRRKLISKLNRKGWTPVPVEIEGLEGWLKENQLEDNAENRVKFYMQSLHRAL